MDKARIVTLIKNLCKKTSLLRRFDSFYYNKIYSNKEYNKTILNLILKEVSKYRNDIKNNDYYIFMMRFKMEYNGLSDKRKKNFIESRRKITYNELIKIENYVKLLLTTKNGNSNELLKLMKDTFILRELRKKNIRGIHKKDGFQDYELNEINYIINSVEFNLLKNSEFLLDYTRTKIKYLSIKDEYERCQFIAMKKDELLTKLKELKNKFKNYGEIIASKKNRVSTTF